MPGFQLNVGIRGRQDPADLATVERAYNKLEANHQLTIATAGKAKAELAKLDLAPEEDAWRQQKIAQIESAVNDNLLYGNAATALDDVQKAIGDLAADPGMIGRLRYQTQRKEWLDNLNKSNLSEDYKDYYRKANPYAYKDKTDEFGNVIGGNAWEAKETWTETVDWGDILTHGIAAAKPDSVSGNQIRYIDKNGKVTTDPMQSVDGEYFDNTTNTWVRLGQDKIRAGIKAYLESNPNAMASARQDYKIAKYRQAENPDTNYGITDPNGMTISFDDFIERRIGNAAYAASYEQRVSKREIGNGLKTYKAALNKSSGGDLDTAFVRTSMFASDPVANIQFTVDKTSEFQKRRYSNTATINTVLNKLNGNNTYAFNEATDIETIKTAIDSEIANYNGEGKDKLIDELYNVYNDLVSANQDYAKAVEGLDETQKANVSFVTSVQNGGPLKAKRSKYDDKILETQKEIFGERGENLIITINNPEMYQQFKAILDGNTTDGYKNLGAINITQQSDGTYKIKIPKDEYNANILLSKALNNSFQITNPTVGGRFFNNISSVFGAGDFSIDVTDEDGESTGWDQPAMLSRKFRSIGELYDKALNETRKNVSENIPSNIVTGVISMPGTLFEKGELLNQYRKGRIDTSTFNALNKFADENADAKIQTIMYHEYPMYIMDKNNGHILGEVKDPNSRIQVGNVIKNANKEKLLSKNPGVASGIGAGYIFDVSPMINSSGGKAVTSNLFNILAKDFKGDYNNENVTIFVPGILGNDVQKAIMNDDEFKANDAVHIADQTKSTLPLFFGTSIGGEPLRIKCYGNDNYELQQGFGENMRTVPINKKVAQDLSLASNNFNIIKNIFNKAHAGSTDKNLMIRAQYLMNEIASIIAPVYSLDEISARAHVANALGINLN